MTCERASGNITTFEGLDESVEAIFDWQGSMLLLSVEDSIRLYDIRLEEWQTIHLPGVQSDFFNRTLTFIDDERIIYMTDDLEPAIQVFNIRTSDVETWVDKDSIGNNSSFHGKGYTASFSPNGRWVTWLERNQSPEGNMTALKLFDLEEQTVTHLLDMTQFPKDVANARAWSSPSWSPDSDQLIFLTDHQLWMLNLELSSTN